MMKQNNFINTEDELTAGKNISCWIEPWLQNEFRNKLSENLETDVVVVGGGIAGVTVAYCLLQEGKKVVLVEDGLIGSGETGRTTAHLVTALDNRYYYFEELFGLEKTKLIAESHKSAIDFVERTIKKEGIDCDFERVYGYLFLHPSDELKSLTKELEASQRAGLNVSEVDDIPGLLTDEGYSLRFGGQAQFHPLKYLAGLCHAIENKGGLIYTKTHAAKIDREGITTKEGFTVKARHVVVATNSPVNNKYAIHLKQKPYRTYVIAGLVKKNKLPRALWWDTGDKDTALSYPPYHYIRVSSYNEEYDMLISGGEDHLTGETDGRFYHEENIFAKLEEWTRKHFPVNEIVYQWSGQVLEPMDGLAFIGKNVFDSDNIYVVTGDSGNGMTHCSIAGQLITDLINGKENKFAKIYSPSRFTFQTSGPYFKEAVEIMMDFFRQSPQEANAKSVADLKKGQAKVVEFKNVKYGVYRGDENHLHIVSGKCTHLGCTPKWNIEEQSWDCPCHGSRFTYDGKVINGPANDDLQYYSEKEFFATIDKVVSDLELQDEE